MIRFRREIREGLTLLSLLSPNRLKIILLHYLIYPVNRVWKGRITPPLPYAISIEPTNTCNLRCPECPTGRNALTRAKGSIEPDFFRRLTDQIASHTLYLNLSFQGEPLMVRYLPDLVVYAKSKRMYISLSTNAHFLDETMAKQLIQSRLDRIIISMDGMTQDTYERYRIGGSLERLKTNLETLVRLKKSIKSHHPLIELQFLVFKHNYHEINQLRLFAHQSGVDRLRLKTAQIERQDAGRELLPEDPRFSRYHHSDPESTELKNTIPNACFRLMTNPVVSWDGFLLPCCFDKDAGFPMGNLNEKPFHEIWKGSTYQSFRNQVFTQRSTVTMCRNCTEGMTVKTKRS